MQLENRRRHDLSGCTDLAPRECSGSGWGVRHASHRNQHSRNHFWFLIAPETLPVCKHFSRRNEIVSGLELQRLDRPGPWRRCRTSCRRPGRTRTRRKIPLRMTGTDGANVDNLVRLGVVPGVVTGDTEGHQSASSCILRVVGVNSEDEPQTPEMQGAGASQHRPASLGIKWAVPGLNRGPSDFQSLALPTELTAPRLRFYTSTRRIVNLLLPG